MGLEHFTEYHREKIIKPKTLGPTGGPNDQWADRRPIGVVFYSQGGSAGNPGFRTPKNPRGWNPYYYGWGATELDAVNDPDYNAKFADKWKVFSENNLQRAKKNNCQGIMVWDIEGSEHDQWTTYEGDAVECLPPEVPQSLVQWLVDRCKALGMWIGFTIRPTWSVRMSHGMPQQIMAGLYANNIIYKMQLYGFTYGDNVKAAYVDSNVQVNAWSDGTSKAFQANVFADVQANRPGWLILPEFSNIGYGNVPRVFSCKWYWDKPQLYPQFIIPKSDGVEPTQQIKDEYLAAFKLGSIPALTVTWDAPWDKWMMEQYKKATTP